MHLLYLNHGLKKLPKYTMLNNRKVILNGISFISGNINLFLENIVTYITGIRQLLFIYGNVIFYSRMFIIRKRLFLPGVK